MLSTLRALRTLGVAVLAAACLMTGAEAASLRVAPIGLALSAQQPSGTIRAWNDGKAPMQVQVRVFRWTVEGGEDVLTPTQDVVASPPMARLLPGAENLIRVVRVSGKPIKGKEGYRLIIDELPNPANQRPGTVTVLVRHAIPVVFSP
jgi:fimbrial chaperone protein